MVIQWTLIMSVLPSAPSALSSCAVELLSTGFIPLLSPSLTIIITVVVRCMDFVKWTLTVRPCFLSFGQKLSLLFQVCHSWLTISLSMRTA